MVTIKTERLILRDLKESDALDLSKNGNTPDIISKTFYLPNPFNISATQKFIQERIRESNKDIRESYELGIEYMGEIIGMMNLYHINHINKKAKIGYWIGKDYRRKGFVSEALKSIIDFAFSKENLNKISAKVIATNIESNNLLEKYGFKKAGELKQDQIIDGELRDCFVWELLKN
ncbi:GNAT family N-acetyltransferase [Candidatus Pacearchaeota archaeon]|nr:GNAT family N-acetyltransferase [Candidatus Pacearchaeota archaeon]